MSQLDKFRSTRSSTMFFVALIVGLAFGFSASVWATSLGTDLSVSGTATVTGNTTLSGTASITGATTITANIDVQSTTATSTFSTGGFNIGAGQFVVQQTNGNVGIGTADPRQVLTVIGSGLFSADLFINGSDINLGSGRSTTTISGAGSGIGIGSTTPGAALAVSTSTAGVNTAFLISNAGTGHTVWAEDVANDTTPFVVDNAGKVGVGTTTPSQEISAVGDIYLQSAATTSLVLNTTGTGGGCIEFHGTQGTKFFLIATSATYAIFQTGSCQ